MEYITISGDVWDWIAYKLYGSESYVTYLMSANQDKLEYFVFPAGIVLNVPELPEVDTDMLPDWRDDE